MKTSLLVSVVGGTVRDIVDFLLSNSNVAEDASVGDTVGTFSEVMGTPKRPADFNLSSLSIAEDASVGDTVGTFGA